MKNKYISLMAGALLSLSGCADFTELDPKGENILATAEELDLLFNYTFNISQESTSTMCGDMVYSNNVDVPGLISGSTRTQYSILLTWDQEGHDNYLASLTEQDALYNTCYSLINKVANTALQRVPYVNGDQALKNRIICEGLTLRALFHFIAVQKFAAAYSPEYAADAMAIPYCLENDDLLEPQPQRTLEYVYNHILDDLNRAIESDALPVNAINRFRVSKPTPYAVKALVLLCMQDFDGAATAAHQALAINDVVDNYNNMLTASSMLLGLPMFERKKLDCEEDYYATMWMEIYSYSTESLDEIEEGHVLRDHMATFDRSMDFMSKGNTYGVTNALMNLDMNSNFNGVGMRSSQMYLVLAEAALHDNNIDLAMQMLDKVRINRIDPTIYQPLEGKVTTMQDAINHLKQTSHGENIFTYYNFVNKKRWSLIDGYKETLVRKINDNTYTLPAASNMWIFPFGQDVLGANPYIHNNY